MNLIVCTNLENRFTSGYIGRFNDLVVGIIREQRKLRIFSSGGKPPVACNKHPVIRVTDDAHEERTH